MTAIGTASCCSAARVFRAFRLPTRGNGTETTGRKSPGSETTPSTDSPCAPSARRLECADGAGRGHLRHSRKPPGARSGTRGRSARRVDRIVVGGDVRPRSDAARDARVLFDLDLPVQFIRGNGDRIRLEADSASTVAVARSRSRDDALERGATQPGRRALASAAWPDVAFDVGASATSLFCHATPRNDTEIFTRLTPEDALLPIFDAAGARSWSAVTRTCSSIDGRVTSDRERGSVGMPFGEPGAYWLLLGPDVELRHTSYDLERAAERIRATVSAGRSSRRTTCCTRARSARWSSSSAPSSLNK